MDAEEPPKKPKRKPLPKGSVKRPPKVKRVVQVAEPEGLPKEPPEIVKLFMKIEAEIARHPTLFAVYRRLNTTIGRSGMAIVLLAIIGGIFYTNYNAQRTAQMSVDIARVSNLQLLRLKIDSVYAEQKELPSSLKDIEERPSPYFVRDEYMFDPGTGRLFEYKPLGPTTYQLCSDFDFSTVAIAHQVPSDVNNPTWNHNSGHVCFSLNAVATTLDRPPDAVDLSGIPTTKLHPGP